MRTFLLLSLCATVICLGGGCGGSQPAQVPAPTPEMQKVAPAAVPITPATPPPPTQPITVAAAAPPAAPPVAVPKLNFAVVKAWDFTKLEDDKLEWVFPGGSKARTKQTGAVWFAKETTGTGPVFNKKLGLSTSEVTHVRITTHVDLVKDAGAGYGTKFNRIRFFWAGPKDVASKPEWPFSEERVVAAKAPDPAQPKVWTLQLADAPLWQGTVDQAFFSLHLPDDLLKAEKAIRFNVIVDKIEFLKQKP